MVKSEYLPKLFQCLKEGYRLPQFFHDLSAGVAIGIISLPLAMAFAIGSGLSPERGLFTAIVAGFLISLFGGSRVQIGGPTGAFVVIVFDIVARYGYEGLATATFIAGFFLIAMGFLRFGSFLKFIPYPVITGLTTGIAIVLFTSQFKDLLGLTLPENPADFLQKWKVYGASLSTFNPWALFVGVLCVATILFFRKKSPKIPGAIIGVFLVTVLVYALDLPVETIKTKFGGIPKTLPSPSLPTFSLEKIRELMPDIITIAILAGLESLLSAVVADGMTGYRHKSNCELVGQGIGNIGSIIFGGIPATGAIARTATNIRLGAKTPISGMVHAITLFFILFLFADLAALIPLSALAAVLTVIAWNMAELPHVKELLKGPRSDVALLLITLGLAVLIDITVAVEIGILLAAVFFMKKMSDATKISPVKEHPFGNIPEHVEVLEISGPLFFGAADLLTHGLCVDPKKCKKIILRMGQVHIIDMTGVQALEGFYERCHKEGIELCLTEMHPKVSKALKHASLTKRTQVFSKFQEAIESVRSSA